MSTRQLDVRELKEAMGGELVKRHCPGGGFSYSRIRGGKEELYGITGAINVMGVLGLPLGDRSARHEAAARIMAWRGMNGLFNDGSGPGHAAHMIIGALNILGEPVPADIAPLAPADPDELSAWLDNHDWRSTHKDLCGPAIPMLASGRVGPAWIDAFTSGISKRVDPCRPLETWCAADASPWCVISCIYHVFSAFDAGRLPYPHQELVMRRLLDLCWEDADDTVYRTICTDGDWAWLLLRLIERLPRHAERAMTAIRRVSARRVAAWVADRESILSECTHALYCYLWSTSVFQSCARDHYDGGYVRDTLNDPALFRLEN